jgi:acyl-CoA thioester hydrolase/thioesterase-3
LGDRFIVRTWVEDMFRTGVKVEFEIYRQDKERLKIACDGWFEYTMVNLKTGRAEVIPDWIAAKYSI